MPKQCMYVTGSYAQSMNTSTKIFLIEATDKLENMTGASRLRFQQLRLDHTQQLLLLYVTLVEQTNRFCKS